MQKTQGMLDKRNSNDSRELGRMYKIETSFSHNHEELQQLSGKPSNFFRELKQMG